MIKFLKIKSNKAQISAELLVVMAAVVAAAALVTTNYF